MSWKLLPKCRQITWFVFYVSMDARLTNQRGLLADKVHGKEILFTWRRESIMKKFRAILEKCNI